MRVKLSKEARRMLGIPGWERALQKALLDGKKVFVHNGKTYTIRRKDDFGTTVSWSDNKIERN